MFFLLVPLFQSTILRKKVSPCKISSFLNLQKAESSLLHKILRNSYDRRRSWHYDCKRSRWIEVTEGYIEESIKNKAKNITRGFEKKNPDSEFYPGLLQMDRTINFPRIFRWLIISRKPNKETLFIHIHRSSLFIKILQG